MNTTKTLMLAAVTALTLGAAAAMAQEQGGPLFAPATWSVPTIGFVAPQASQHRGIQFGASDVAHNADLGVRAYDQYDPFAGGN